jgi:hypothetical protein
MKRLTNFSEYLKRHFGNWVQSIDLISSEAKQGLKFFEYRKCKLDEINLKSKWIKFQQKISKRLLASNQRVIETKPKIFFEILNGNLFWNE